jgi:cytochrome c-type biogenesis protein NrfE
LEQNGAVQRIRLVLWVLTGVLWLATVRLTIALGRSELSWRYVAQQSRIDAPWYYRLAALWGGSEGSMLFFTTVVATVAVVAAHRCQSRAPLRLAVATVTGLAAVSMLFASPFGSLSAPAVRGFGLTPILEHPAMAIHPPLLYLGLAATLGAAMATTDRRSAQRWLRWSLAFTTLAMAIGAVWSYVEQGWGGYWAWDPVENTSLLVWLAALIAVHTPAGHPRRRALDAAPWVVALGGAAMVRSGSTPSIHGFAEQASVGWSLVAVTVVTAGALVVLLGQRMAPEGSTADATAARPAIGPGLPNIVLTTATFAVVLVGTLTPVAIDLFADRPAAVRGVFYSRVVGPLALVALPFLALRLRHRRGRLAHVGIVVLIAGVAASTFDQSATIGIADGQRVSAAGLDVIGGPIRIEAGSRADTQAVVVDLVVDGVQLRPSLVAYPDRGGVLAETAMATWPWRDVQVTLGDATDEGLALVTVRQRPLVWLIWIGAVLTSLGAITPAAGRRRTGVAASVPATH